MSMIAAILGRLLLALIFAISGIQKIVDPAPAAQMLQSTNLPAYLAMPTGVFELIAGLLLAIGLATRLVSVLLAGFVALTIFFFHNQFADPAEATAALKNLAMVGGLLMVFAYGQMRGSYDHLRASRKIHEAELRAARAEAKADVAAAAPTTVVTDVNGDGVPEVRPKRRWF